MSALQVKVPDIGDFDSVEVIEILVSVGDEIVADQDIIMLESDKAAMAVPSNAAGMITDLHISVGDKVSMDSPILTLQVATHENSTHQADRSAVTAPDSAAVTHAKHDADMHADVVVLGSGPGGYTAAFRAADLGKRVIMVERHERIGGVCLNVGCIPSKALLHTAQVINEAADMGQHGVIFAKPDIDIGKINEWKNSIITQLTGGLSALAGRRNVTILRGEGRLSGAHTIKVATAEGSKLVSFDNCIIAAGSRVTNIPSFPNDDPRIMDSTDALDLADIPAKLLVIGGGIIGLEMATVYHALGSKITIVEMQDSLIAAADKDIVKPLLKKIKTQYEAVYLNTSVISIDAKKQGLLVKFEGKDAPKSAIYDKILVAVGRSPNGTLIDAQHAGVYVDSDGFIPVNERMQTNVAHIYAIGDIVGQPMLAHKAVHEAKVAAEVISGLKSAFDPMTIPSVAYTDPEVAWMGITEKEAKAQKI